MYLTHREVTLLKQVLSRYPDDHGLVMGSGELSTVTSFINSARVIASIGREKAMECG